MTGNFKIQKVNFVLLKLFFYLFITEYTYIFPLCFEHFKNDSLFELCSQVQIVWNYLSHFSLVFFKYCNTIVAIIFYYSANFKVFSNIQTLSWTTTTILTRIYISNCSNVFAIKKKKKKNEFTVTIENLWQIKNKKINDFLSALTDDLTRVLFEVLLVRHGDRMICAS